MQLKLLEDNFTVCKVHTLSNIDVQQQPLFIAVTEDELSVVCDSNNVPSDVIASEEGWRGFKIVGELDFALVGILSRISTLLADEGISIFALSTYNTDYILIKEIALDNAITTLTNNYDILN